MGSPKKASEVHRRYGRDYLLQLRMHPSSLQKPQNLPAMEIVKDRLYLHQIDGVASPSGDESQYHHYTDDIRTFMKHDHAYKRFSQRSSPGYTSRPEYAPYQKYNVPLSISKYRPCSPQKQLYRASSYKMDISTEDFFENINDFQNAPWLKENFPLFTNESEWNLNQKNNSDCKLLPNNGCNPKCKKKLSIIDPKTGKNILEGIEDLSQTSISSKEPNDEVKEKNVESQDQFLSELPKSQKPDSSEEELMREYSEYKRSEDTRLQYQENENILPSSFCFSSTGGPPSGEEKIEARQLDGDGCGKNSEQLKDVKTKVSKSGVSENETSDFVGEDIHESNLKEKILMLRDKVFAMKQEQQKMVILQSFLRFKKQQLDESFRSLDDKKMDIIHWEYTLYTKAKNLHEKEYCIEARLRNLKKREKQVEEREKWLDFKEKEMRNKYNNVLKRDGTTSIENGELHGESENNASSNKDAMDDNVDKENCLNTFHKDNNILPPKPKDYSSGDICEIRANSQSDYSSSLNYSRRPEGKKCLPDHIKHWFSQREKNTENGVEKGNKY